MRISVLNGVNNASDDSVLMISYTTDGGATYQTKKIRMEDMVADVSFDALADTNLGILTKWDMLPWHVTDWVAVSGATGNFTTSDSKTVTVTNGLITNIA